MLTLSTGSARTGPMLQQSNIRNATGGARGIGLEVARGLAEAGANVAIHYRTSKIGDEVAASIARSNGVKTAAYQADVTDQAANEELISKLVREFGRLDIVVINAGVSGCFDALDCSAEKYRQQMAVNLDGAFYTAQAAGKVFKSQGEGNIIFTTSMSASIVNGPQSQSVVG